MAWKKWIKSPTYQNKKDDSLNRMVDALREILGLDPLYEQQYVSSMQDREIRRFHIHTYSDKPSQNYKARGAD